MPESPNESAQKAIDQLLDIMRRLRDPDGGCPWDVAQTFATIAPYTVEEAYEVADAIDREDKPDLCNELGDLLFQVVFHARMAEEEGSFNFSDVVHSICDKLTRRHPHVFAGHDVSPDQLSAQWEAFKQAERKQKSDTAGILDDIPNGMPALTRAEKLQKRAARVGFDWPDVQPVIEKIHEEMDELKEELKPPQNKARIAQEMGDVLFSCVNLARYLDVDPEWALRSANQRFKARFGHIEQQLRTENRCVSDAELDELDELWQQAKLALPQST